MVQKAVCSLWRARFDTKYAHNGYERYEVRIKGAHVPPQNARADLWHALAGGQNAVFCVL